MAKGDFKLNAQTGNWEAQQDGVFEKAADDPADRIRVQLRKGFVVNPADAQLFTRVGSWPGEPSPDDEEAAATAKRATAPANKAAPAPEDK